MRKWWWIFALIFLPLVADPTEDGCRAEIQKIDAQIKKLQIQKEKHVILARKYQQQGDDWQYNTGRIDDAHAAWGKADDERSQIIQIQGQIDLLFEKKQRIYQYYPQLQYPPLPPE